MVVFTVLQSVGSPLGAGRGLRNVSWSLNREYPRDMWDSTPAAWETSRLTQPQHSREPGGVYHLDQVGG